jgi:tRNA A-37 threonylcarbamoyl transferase component Bud32
VQAAPEAPIPFGRYTLLRRIGAGGMGEVYLARDEAAVPPRACVVKKVLPHLAQNRQFVGRFLDESKVVVNLDHPNIARVYAMGEVDGHYYLAMEYVQGKTVSRFMHRLRQRGEELALGLILLVGERMCRGLAYAHDAVDAHRQPLHLVHRDLSPANVCVSYAGEVKIIDFGAAQSTLKEEQTAPRVVIGNLAYMSPEQARKQRVDRRADIYSTGAVLWELLAWKPLPQKGDPIERWRKAANPAWDLPSRHRTTVPADVEAVVMKALSRSPDERFADAAALLAELQRLRMKHAPGGDERVLGELLSGAFLAEKAAEDAALEGLARGLPISAAPTDPSLRRRLMMVPATAMAFEHTALSAPAGYVPPEDRITDPAEVPGGAGAAAQVSESRVGFGVSIPSTGATGDPAWVREIEGVFSAEEAGPDTASLRPPTPPLPTWLLYLAAFLGALGLGFLGVWALFG